MRHYDPWIFGMLWEREHQEELRRLADARLSRQATQQQAAGSPHPIGRSLGTSLRSLVDGILSAVRQSLRRPLREAEGGPGH
jgi:hypothetical protein